MTVEFGEDRLSLRYCFNLAERHGEENICQSCLLTHLLTLADESTCEAQKLRPAWIPSLGRDLVGWSSVLVCPLVLDALSLGTWSGGSAREPPQMAS